MKSHLPVLAATALCVLAAACGSVQAPRAGSPRADTQRLAPPGPGHEPATEAGNRKLAAAEAAWLMSLVPVPAHSVRLSSPPPSVSWPAMGKPGLQSLIDHVRSWRLAMSFAAASAWIAAHRPAGLHQDGVATTPTNGFAYSYPGTVNPAWAGAELDIEVAPAGQAGSVLRADGMVGWLDPVPVRDTTVGKRLRVLAAANCPATDDGVVGVTNPGANLTHALLPAGRPVSGLACTYRGMNGQPFRLRSQQRLAAVQAVRLAVSMSRTPISHPIGAIYNCPMDDGSAELIALSYRGVPDVDLWVWLTGCGGVTNGYIEAGYLLP